MSVYRAVAGREWSAPRLIASIPLVRAGYPMINITLDRRAEYYEGIRRVSYQAVDVATLLLTFHPGERGRSRTDDKMFC